MQRGCDLLTLTLTLDLKIKIKIKDRSLVALVSSYRGSGYQPRPELTQKLTDSDVDTDST